MPGQDPFAIVSEEPIQQAQPAAAPQASTQAAGQSDPYAIVSEEPIQSTPDFSVKQALTGPNTALGTPLAQQAQSEISGVSDIAHGNISQGARKIWDSEVPHVIPGSPIEKLIQHFNPDFHGGATQEFLDANKRATAQPLVDAAQFIDKTKNPMGKAIAESAQSLLSPDSIATMVATGGMGLVKSPQALGLANRLISAGFSVSAISNAYKHLEGFKDAYDKGDTADAEYQLTHAVLSGTMSVIAGAHAAGVPLPLAGEKEKAVVGKVSDVANGAVDRVKDVLDQQKANRTAKVAGKDIVEANKEFKQAIPSTKSTPYEDKDLGVARNYLEPSHEARPIEGVQHTVDALDHSIEGIEDKVSQHVGIIPHEPIATDVMDDVKNALQQNERGKEFVDAGLKEVEGLNLDDIDMSRADNVRRQLNLENKAILKKNNYDLAAARAADPGFAAREAAAESLRNGIYNQLEAHGIEGVRELRQEEGSLIKVRNAAQSQVFNAEKVVRGSGATTPLRKVAAGVTKMAATGAGAAIAGPTGAITGSVLGDLAANSISPGDITRDQLVQNSFNKKIATGQPGGITVNLHAPPEKPVPVGTQAELPHQKVGGSIPEQPSLFGTQAPYPEPVGALQSVQNQLNLLQKEIRPLKAILNDPAATSAEKVEAARKLSNLPLADLQNVSAESNPSGGRPASLAPDNRIPTEHKQTAQSTDDMHDPDTRFSAAQHEAGHAVISEMLNPGSVEDTAITDKGGLTNITPPSGKEDINQLSPDEVKDMLATSLAGGLSEPGGTTGKHVSGDLAVRDKILGGKASTVGQNISRVLSGKVPNDEMLKAGNELAESRARVQALLADPKTRQAIDHVAEKLTVRGKLTGDQVREFLKEKGGVAALSGK